MNIAALLSQDPNVAPAFAAAVGTPRAHLRRSGTESAACRHWSRPLRRLTLQEFSDTPIAERCPECDQLFEDFCALLRKAVGGAS